jgi:hypothetical protein
MTGRRSESGFALLFIFAMAATVAIMLYMELPRVAFEAQRDKEQLLIDRGEQYSRAISLYVRKFNRYPPDFDALDNTQNLRFLRGHYADPITGKNEWRLIHAGPGGILIDSVNTKKKDDSQAAAPQNFITEGQQVGGNQVDPALGGVNIATRTRPSDQPGAAGDPNNPQGASPPPDQFAQPGQLQPDQFQPNQLQPNQLQPGLVQPGLPQLDPNGQLVPNPVPGLLGQQLMGQQPTGQQPMGQQVNGLHQQTQPNIPAGVNLINQLLTGPRPGGLNGVNGQNGQQQPTIDQYGNPVPANPLTGNTAGNAVATVAPAPPVVAAAPTIGGGIAGVASKREQEGIKIYNEKKKYNEWEFVYDVNKARGAAAPPPAPAQPAAATTQQQPQQTPPVTTPTPVTPVTPATPSQ